MSSRLAAALAGATAAAAIGSIAWATIPDANGVIHACVKPNGDIRLIDSEAGIACKDSEMSLSWNQMGPAGPPGVSGYEILESDLVEMDPGEADLAVAECPRGKKVLGGGARSNSTAAFILASIPQFDTGWLANAVNTSNTLAATVSAYAICAQVS